MGITRLFIESNTALRRACAWTSHSYAIIVLSSGSLALGLFFRICRNLDMRQTNENIPVFDGCFRRFQYLKEDTEFAKMPSSSSRSYCHGSLCPANTFPRIIHRLQFRASRTEDEHERRYHTKRLGDILRGNSIPVVAQVMFFLGVSSCKR